jgi:outer membrane protein
MPNRKCLPTLRLALGLLALPLSLSAQDKALTWNDCVKEAAAHNPDLLSAEQSRKAAENGHLASLGQFLPQLSLSGSVGRSGTNSSIEGALSDPSYKENASLRLTASENIFSGFKDIAAVDSSNAQLDLAKAQLTQAKAQLSRDLKNAFYQLLYSQKQIILLRTIADRQKANLQLVEMNFKGGTDNKGSLLQSQAGSAQAQYEVDQAQRALRIAQRELARLLGRNQLDPLEVGGDFEVPSTSGETPDFRKLTLTTPAHAQALAQLHSSESRYTSARGDLLPTLSANASLSRSGADFDSLSPGWSAGLSLSFPFFDGGQNIFNLKSAEESKRGAEYDLRSSDMKTAIQLENAFASFQNALDNTQVQQAFLKAAQIREEVAKAQYLNGLLVFQNWDLIETNLTNQQKAELSSRLSAKTAEANWELTQGKGAIP